ncbi:hypothetical protein [Acidovorax sp.]|jgi:hypothetical protein|uniref:hypothetical protein n=1 Tax=Acidovorax sp. TaxID=1872122 RepID=UPI0025C6935E|nr:hypothetical protein [Acidovorax sp.]MCI5070626.1 hypothetical protein [Acidovorax sp.]
MPASHKTQPPRPRRWLAWLGWAAAVLVCLAVFGMYTVPDFMVMLADQMWSCF